MRRHLVGIGLGTAVLVTAGFLPFLDGGHDPVSWPLAWAAYVFGVVGLLLVPVGVIWLAYELRRRRTPPPAQDRRFVLRVVGLVATALVAALVGLATLPISLAAGVIVLVLGGLGLSRALIRLRRPAGPSLDPAPLYLIIVPLGVSVSLLVGHDAAVERSRMVAADRAGEMIAEIERYRSTRGRYPESLVAVWPDYLPGVIGVRGYTYEPSGAAYNIAFEQFRFYPIGTREFVVYNPRDEQTMISHASWRMIAPDLEGHYASGGAGRPHWRFFWFD